jgi:hypothetical protein
LQSIKTKYRIISLILVIMIILGWQVHLLDEINSTTKLQIDETIVVKEISDISISAVSYWAFSEYLESILNMLDGIKEPDLGESILFLFEFMICLSCFSFFKVKRFYCQKIVFKKSLPILALSIGGNSPPAICM